MPKMTRKEVAIYYYNVMIGYSPVKETAKYAVLTKGNVNIYIGKNGAIRKGKSIAESISLTDRTDYEKMRMKVEEHKRRE